VRLGTLVRNEAIKVRHDRAFWIALVGLAGLIAIAMGGTAHVMARNPNVEPLSLPMGWPRIVAGASAVLVLFISVTVILSVTNEFRWGTLRQHFVAGLSRDEFYVAKTLVLLATVLLFFVTAVVVGGAFALPYTSIGSATLVRWNDARLMAGSLLDLTGYAGLAFLIGVALRRSGVAIGVFFLYLLLEQIVGDGLSKLDSILHVVPRYLPSAVFGALHQPARYYPTLAHASRSGPPSAAAVLPTGTVVALAFAWLAAFLVAAYLILRRRDL